MVTLSYPSKICPCVAVICVAARVGETVFLCVFGEQFLLVHDGIALALEIIVTTEAEI